MSQPSELATEGCLRGCAVYAVCSHPLLLTFVAVVLLVLPHRYYAYWERRLFGAVTAMVVSALAALQARLHACRTAAAAPGGLLGSEAADEDAPPPPPPLFRVCLSLIQPEVVLVPSAVEVSKQLGRLLRNLVESSKPFVRWMDGTCLEAPEQ